MKKLTISLCLALAASSMIPGAGFAKSIATSNVRFSQNATIEWSVDVLAAKKVVIILTFAAPGIAEKHAEEAAQFIASIKKIE